VLTVQTGSNARLKEAFGEALPAVILSSSLRVILLIAVTLSAGTSCPSLASLAGSAPASYLAHMASGVKVASA
jgi:uncharacterized membrane protein YdcZ (DUF606 family)